MMTKEQSLSGVSFNYLTGAKTRPFCFKPWSNWKDGDPIGMLNYFGRFEANVSRVNNHYFDCYTTILGKVVKARIYFKDLHL
jgi:hypothetical protein